MFQVVMDVLALTAYTTLIAYLAVTFFGPRPPSGGVPSDEFPREPPGPPSYGV
jgi:hypothetical protein